MAGIRRIGAKGQGSVRKRGNGRFEYRVNLGPGPDGADVIVSASGGSRADAIARGQAKVKALQGRAVRVAKTATIADAIAAHDRRLDARVAAGTLAKSTRDSSYGPAAKRLAPIAGMRLENITPTWVEHWTATGELGRSSSTRRSTWLFLRAALRTARRDGLCAGVDPFQDVKGPAGGRDKEPHHATAADVEQLLDGAEEPLRTLWVVYAYTGLRSAEGRGLRWQDVDLDAREITLVVTQARGLKSRAAVRRVPMLPVVADALVAHRARSGLVHPTALVFPNRKGAMLDKGYMRRQFDRTAPAGLTPHGLRHGVVTRLLEAGVPVHVVAAIVGHKSPSVTLNAYSHSVTELERQALGALT